MLKPFQIEALGDTRGTTVQANAVAVVSQFVSLDSHGVAVMWITQEISAEGGSNGGSNTDFGASPWSRVLFYIDR